MRAHEFTNHRVMAKIEKTGQIVQILRHADHVKFSDEPGWFLINTEPGRRTGTSVKWIPDSTRFAWVKKFDSLEEMRATKFMVEYDLKVSRDADGVAIKATAGGKQLGHAEFFFDKQGRLDPQAVWVDERFHGQGIAKDMYDHLKDQGYTIIRSWDQTDAGRGFWNKHRGPEATVWESQRRLPAAIEEFLDSLNPDDCGVEDIGAYRIHFEGFTSDCKSSSDYRRDPEAVYQQVYQDFIQREGGQRPLVQDMVGDERFPILYSIFRHRRSVTESQQATARQVLNYINKTHHEPFRPGEKMYAAVMAHPQWQLKRVPLLNLNIPDQEYDDVDYDDDEPEADPYGRVMMVEPGHAGEVSQHLIDKKPIVIDADRYIIDGNHRAWAAKYLLNRDYIDAWVPVKQIEEITRRDFLRGAGAMAGTAAMGQPVQAQTQEDVEDILTSAANLYAILVKHFRQDPRTKALGAIFKSMSFSLKYREKFREEYEQATLGLDLLQKKPNEYKEYVQKFLSNYEKIKRDLESLQDLLTEVNYPDELSVGDQIQQYFFKRGYELAGEGRDQMAFESPRGTILKVLGIGEDEREQVVKRYVRFFERNQQNPFYPRIYNSGDFAVDGETYFVYEMERVNYVANEEATLDYIEKLMSAVDRGQGAEYVKKNPVPNEIGTKQLAGLLQATEHMMRALGGTAPLDLTAVENLGRRDDGHLVIVDPYSL